MRKYEWPDIVKTVRLCRAENGNAAPTRLAVETIIGGGDTLRLDIAIRAVEAEHGHRPEYLDTLPDQILRHLKDPRKEGGLLPIPEAIKARLREPFLSALITIASAVLAELEQGAQNATILVTDTERDLGGVSRTQSTRRVTTPMPSRS